MAGKRVGPGEVEDALTSHPAIAEAAVIGVPDDLKGTALVGVVVLRNGAGQPPVEGEMISHVAAQLGKPLAPKRVLVVPALPRTRSGKTVRATITRAFLGQPLGDLSSIENPSALEAIATLRSSIPSTIPS